MEALSYWEVFQLGPMWIVNVSVIRVVPYIMYQIYQLKSFKIQHWWAMNEDAMFFKYDSE